MIRKNVKLKHDIPIPNKKKTLQYPLKRMLVGDSFLVNDQAERKKVRTMAERLGIKITSQTREDGKIRVWRIE